MMIAWHQELLRWLLLLVLTTALVVANATSDLMRSRVEQVRSERNPAIGTTSVTAAALLGEFYQQRKFALAWTGPERIDDLIKLLGSAYEHGLDPKDYHLPTLRTLGNAKASGRLSARQSIDLDFLLTDGLIRFAYHTHFGKVDPTSLDSNWNFEHAPVTAHPVRALQAAVAADSLERFWKDLIPEPYFYVWLRHGLARYREIRAQGAWPSIPMGPSLKRGAVEPRVVLLRERLRRTNDLGGGNPAKRSFFDKTLEQAVVAFQSRHGLEPDGIVGPLTRQALNVPVEQRIDQIRVNLERMRWIYQNLPDNYLLVDIAGYTVDLIQNGRRAWEARAQVGQPYRETPVFRAEMEYLVFNPAWTVPPVILINDILPVAKRDPAYLSRNHMRLLDDNGQTIDIKAVDWPSVSYRRFPYTVRQDPIANNPLGRVKFVFPNRHSIYLHDTPSKSLFDRWERTFSSGCIRVERPVELAALLLQGAKDWNAERIQRVLDSGRTETIRLPAPCPVLLFYWTAEADHTGRVHFRPDIYGRDEAVLSALGGPS